MEKHIISKLKNEFSFLGKKKLFVLSMWKLTLGYGSWFPTSLVAN